MKHILNAIKREIVISFNNSESLAKKAAVAQESYFNDKSNEFFFKNWIAAMEDLSRNEQSARHLISAYRSMCSACQVEEQTIEELLAESNEKAAKRAARKPRGKRNQNTEPKAE